MNECKPLVLGYIQPQLNRAMCGAIPDCLAVGNKAAVLPSYTAGTWLMHPSLSNYQGRSGGLAAIGSGGVCDKSPPRCAPPACHVTAPEVGPAIPCPPRHKTQVNPRLTLRVYDVAWREMGLTGRDRRVSCRHLIEETGVRNAVR